MGNALIEGTNKANGDVIIWIMADLSDDLNTIPKFLKKIENGYDLVFGSRYIKGGSPGDIPSNKAFFSRGFANLSRIFIGIKVHDITNAFRAFKKNVFNSVNLKSTDFAISPEFALKAHLANFKMSIKYFIVFLSSFCQKFIS
jgi:glycosyltransferase involved in cell wall biosynthesis